MYIIGGLIVVCYLAMGIASRREIVEQDVGFPLRFFYKTSVWIYKRACIRRLPFFYSAQVEKDLSSLHPGEGKEQQITKYYIRKIALFLAVIFAGTLLGILVRYNSRASLILSEEGRITRGDYREGNVEIQLKADCGEGEGGSFRLEMAPVLLTEEEAQALAEELWERLPEYILGENESLDKVSHDLVLEEGYEDYPFQLEWESRSPAIAGRASRGICV